MKLETQEPTTRAEPEKEQSIELRVAAWVLTMVFGLFVALLLFAPLIHYLKKLPEGFADLVGALALVLFLAAGIGFGCWLGGESEGFSWLARKSPPWAGEESYIEIKLPNWISELLFGLFLSLFPIAFAKNLVPAPFFPLVAGLLLLAGNGFAIWLHSHRLANRAKTHSTHN